MESSAKTSDAPTVPVHQRLDAVYKDINNSVKEIHEARYANLRQRFKVQYGCVPAFYVRAPGRVNIIGEHIDYCGYSVLPAAIEQDFVMAYVPVAAGEDGCDVIEIANIDKD